MQAVLGKRGDYSVRAMLHLARHDGEGRQKARLIAAAVEIPGRYATQILANLVSQGLVNATAGPAGGYQLSRSTDQISLLEIVEAAEGPVRLERCVLRGGSCDWVDVCPIHEAWTRAQDAMVNELASTTLDDLTRIDAAITAGIHQPRLEVSPHLEQTPRKGRR
jgi:Rrf2 family iron-sulfur cluster assembly transcriptional regulator